MDKAVLTLDDVNKLIEDAGAFKAGRLIMLIASDTDVNPNVQDHMDDNDIQLVRTRWRAP